jgi:hypothetical protein
MIYIIDDDAPYNADDETWEFTPGSRVSVEEKILEGKAHLIATRLCP